MNTIDGASVYPESGHPSLYAIGVGLGRMPRFAGQTKIWYSILPHVFVVAAVVDPAVRLQALLHDAGETVVGDQVATWKNELTERDEDIVLERIHAEHGLEWPWPQDVKDEVRRGDLLALRAEIEIIGHSEPQHPFFQAIELDEQAYSLTMQNVATDRDFWMSPEYAGTLYQSAVEAELSRLHARTPA